MKERKVKAKDKRQEGLRLLEEKLFDKIIDLKSPELIAKGYTREQAEALIKLFDGELPL